MSVCKKTALIYGEHKTILEAVEDNVGWCALYMSLTFYIEDTLISYAINTSHTLPLVQTKYNFIIPCMLKYHYNSETGETNKTIISSSTKFTEVVNKQ